jgi:hypothetical protein
MPRPTKQNQHLITFIRAEIMKTGNVSFVKSIIYLFILLALIPTVSAIAVDIDGDLPAEAKEGDIVEFNLTISGIPKAAGLISFETDLGAYGNSPLYYFPDHNVTTNSSSYVLDLSDTDGTVVIQVNGRVPVIKEVVQVDKLTLVKLDSKRTGYAYYRVKLMDDKRNPLKDGDTKTFSISVPEIESFQSKLVTIEDPFFRTYLTSMFDKGLVYESNELADHLNSRDEGSVVPLLWAAIGLVLALIAGVIIGIRLSNSEEDDEL